MKWVTNFVDFLISLLENNFGNNGDCESLVIW